MSLQLLQFGGFSLLVDSGGSNGQTETIIKPGGHRSYRAAEAARFYGGPGIFSAAEEAGSAVEAS